MKLRYHCVDDFERSEMRVFDIDATSDVLYDQKKLISAFLKSSGANQITVLYFNGHMLSVRYLAEGEAVYLTGFLTVIY